MPPRSRGVLRAHLGGDALAKLPPVYRLRSLTKNPQSANSGGLSLEHCPLPIEDTRPAAKQEREAALIHLLQRVWTYSVSTKSDDARAFADEVIEAAHRQLLTTQIVPGGTFYGRLLKLTAAGVTHLEANAFLLTQEEERYAEVYCR